MFISCLFPISACGLKSFALGTFGKWEYGDDEPCWKRTGLWELGH